MAINRSDMSVRQKEQAYQELTRMLINAKREHPEDVPDTGTIMQKGDEPFGAIWSGDPPGNNDRNDLERQLKKYRGKQ